MSIKSKFLNLYNALMAEEVNDPEVPQSVQKTITIPGDDPKKVLVTIGDQVIDPEGNVIPDGDYEIDGESLVLVVTEGKGDIKAKADVPSDQEVIKQDDVEVTLNEDTQDAIDQVVDANIAAEDNPDTTTEDVEQNIAVENAFAKFQEVIDDLSKRVAELESKLSASDAKVQEVNDKVENFSQVTPSTKVAINPYQQFANLFN